MDEHALFSFAYRYNIQYCGKKPLIGNHGKGEQTLIQLNDLLSE